MQRGTASSCTGHGVLGGGGIPSVLRAVAQRGWFWLGEMLLRCLVWFQKSPCRVAGVCPALRMAESLVVRKKQEGNPAQPLLVVRGCFLTPRNTLHNQRMRFAFQDALQHNYKRIAVLKGAFINPKSFMTVFFFPFTLGPQNPERVCVFKNPQMAIFSLLIGC